MLFKEIYLYFWIFYRAKERIKKMSTDIILLLAIFTIVSYSQFYWFSKTLNLYCEQYTFNNAFHDQSCENIYLRINAFLFPRYILYTKLNSIKSFKEKKMY